MNELEKLFDAMATLQQLQAQHDKEFAEYDGYSWDWNGYWYRNLEQAREDVTVALNNIIDQRVEEKLKEQKGVQDE